ncbi:hypothetical protein [Flavobacterium coralii]|uniref:hypothetical protein n=1 Tax=Flavobacterium coralii TaxID=2838017 RepID=UPI000C3A3879|nr:hypothetical protein [Flavobacterium sp.]|tara:strand:- start:3899 stop:4741 length:843 start_codon:yes stop_codon:yes gene_type:complete
MPGATATNIRKADLAEDLGRLLLRQFCAIAPISKTDDFGIDTIATLLVVDEKTKLRELANKSFGVQFKSKSVRELLFIEPYEYQWLLNLDYPYFIGSVDIQKSSMEFYTIHWVNSLPSIKENCRGLVISLDENNNTEDNRYLRISLGPPILTLNLHDISDKDSLEVKRNLLKKWILLEYENIKVRDIGFTKACSWDTNSDPKFEAVNKILYNRENLNIYKESYDFIDSVLLELKLFNKDRQIQKAVDTINNALNKKGVELSQINGFDYDMFEDFLKSSSK